jgi:uncharacterized protein
MRPGLALVAALIAAPSVQAAGRLERGSAGPFDYNRGAPLELVVQHRFERQGVAVRAVEFSVDSGLRARAYLALPSGGRRHPAIVFVPGRRQTREYFLDEAIADAKRGAIGLSLEDLSDGYPSFTDVDRSRLIRRVIAVRRALDLLLARPDVDAGRIAVVGHSDGAELAGIVAGADRRAAAYVLMSGGGVWDRQASPAYNRLVAPLDSARYIGRAAPAALFFQSALSDQYVPRADALRYQTLASSPKRVVWYDADHNLNSRAFRERQAWLAARGVLGR